MAPVINPPEPLDIVEPVPLYLTVRDRLRLDRVTMVERDEQEEIAKREGRKALTISRNDILRAWLLERLEQYERDNAKALEKKPRVEDLLVEKKKHKGPGRRPSKR